MSIEPTPKGVPFFLDINGLKVSPGKLLFKKLKMLAERVLDPVFKQDSCLINDGYEGSGKTNASLIEATVLHYLTEFPISLFFKTSSALEFLKTTDHQIVILDEPSLESLSLDSRDVLNRDFLRLTSMMRKKRHILIINFAKFWKFPDFLVVDRPLGLIHMKGIKRKEIGKYYYIPQKKLEALWNDKKTKKKLSYERLKRFRSQFSYLVEDIFKHVDIRVEGKLHATYEDYEEEKDKAIGSIGKPKTGKWGRLTEEQLRERVALSNLPIAQKSILLNIDQRKVYELIAKLKAQKELVGGSALEPPAD